MSRNKKVGNIRTDMKTWVLRAVLNAGEDSIRSVVLHEAVSSMELFCHDMTLSVDRAFNIR